MKRNDFNKENKIDLLKFFFQYQLDEINYRREREYRIFTWTSSLLLALIAGLLVYRDESIMLLGFYGFAGKITISITVFLITIFSISWQNKNAKNRMESWNILSIIADQLNAYEENFFDVKSKGAILPKDWKGFGRVKKSFFRRIIETNYSTATLTLGILAIAMIWITR